MMKYRTKSCGRLAIVGLLAAVVLAGGGGCDRSGDAAAPDPADPATPASRRIVCTVGMVADIVRAVVGPHAEVVNIIGEGVDPHLYAPTRGDVLQLTGADVVFYSGLMLEGKMADALVRVGRRGKPVYAVTERIDPAYLLEPEGFAGHADPHVWMDVQGWMKAVESVAEAMTEVDPARRDVYLANAAVYVAQLDRLDAYVREVIGAIPQRRRVLVTAHDAFNYFGRAYGIEVSGIQGISTESEAGLEDINRLVDLIVDRDLRAVFVESSVADRNVRALIEGARSRGRTLTIGGTLYSDAMGPPGTYEGTYIGMLDHNATVIARALGGGPPPRGLNGRLSGGPGRGGGP